MKLEELGIEKKQIEILEKKKIVSAEALLRQEPLHYWNFTSLMPLDFTDPDVVRHMTHRMPFAITGICISYTEETQRHANLAKIKIKDDRTGNILHVNVMGVEAFKYTYLENSAKNPCGQNITIPKEINKISPVVMEDIKQSCKKKIEEINALNTPSLKMLGGLKTGGVDACSKVTFENAKRMLPEETITWIKTITRAMKDSSQATLQCIRWYLRGLKLDLCIRKVQLDEIRLGEVVYNKHLIVGGFIQYNDLYGSYSVMNPPVLSDNIAMYHQFYVQYSAIKGWSNMDHARFVNRAIRGISAFDIIPSELLQKAKLPSFQQAAMFMHHPLNWKQCQIARKRMIFDDLVYLNMKLEANRTNISQHSIAAMPAVRKMRQYIQSRPYALTNGQWSAIQSISKSMADGAAVNTLVQGDVGTGKTCVAFALLIQAAENGFQGALAAPYTTLAWQHYRDLQPEAEKLGIHIAFLTSETKASEKKKICAAVKNGDVSILVGTHSIFADAVEYQSLGLAVIDEEHKFGVMHREHFLEKGVQNCHKITMSATPIPKSLASTIYGEQTGILTITDKPAERLAVKTTLTCKDTEAADCIIQEVRKGHQAYIVCPAIDTNTKKQEIVSIEEKEKIYRSIFEPAGIHMEILTGKMKAAEKTAVMRDFADGLIDVLMATTVIEVGMNVPNATVIAITGADRFGFSTLHQLRGRVGRGKDQSYCILQTESPNDKLAFLTQTNDGFEIAEKDLELRGPGTLFGDRQSGNNYFIDLMLAYPNMFRWIREETRKYCGTQTGKDIIRRYEELFLPEEKR